MIAKNCTVADLHDALSRLNPFYKNNLAFKTLEHKGRAISFTLTVESSNAPGAKRSPEGRKIHAACWHAHGNFFQELFKVAPDAEVKSGYAGIITRHGGNWQDWNCGSAYYPRMASEACECNNF